jgi:hypothetical protein
MKRRDFLKNAGAAMVPAALPSALWGAPSPALENQFPLAAGRLLAREQVPLTAVLFDERYADCRAFAEALELHGAKAFATNQDAVALWYGPLRAHLEKNPGRVAGLATYADFSSSIACGRELAFSIHFEGHHDARRSRTTVSHRLTTTGPTMPHQFALANPNDVAAALTTDTWANQLAEALWQMPEPVPVNQIAEDIAGAKEFPTSLQAKTQTPASAHHPGFLISWLLSRGPLEA